MARITVRLDDDLYTRLLLFAQGRSQGQEPDVSAIVREALEQYLVPLKRQTGKLQGHPQVSDSLQASPLSGVRHHKRKAPHDCA